jgi:hypothetical protein
MASKDAAALAPMQQQMIEFIVGLDSGPLRTASPEGRIGHHTPIANPLEGNVTAALTEDQPLRDLSQGAGTIAES